MLFAQHVCRSRGALSTACRKAPGGYDCDRRRVSETDRGLDKKSHRRPEEPEQSRAGSNPGRAPTPSELQRGASTSIADRSSPPSWLLSRGTRG